MIHTQELKPGTDDRLNPISRQKEKEEQESERESVCVSGVRLIQQDAKSNPGALITHSIINQSPVSAGL